MAGLVWGLFCQVGIWPFSRFERIFLLTARGVWVTTSDARLHIAPQRRSLSPTPAALRDLVLTRGCSGPGQAVLSTRARLDFPPFLIRSEASLCRRRPEACKLVSGGAENAPYQEAQFAKRDGEGPRGRDQS